MCPDGDCPDNPVIGQVHNSPEFGELVFDGQTWSNENYNFLQSVSIEGTYSNGSDISTATTTAQFFGSSLFESVNDMIGKYMDKSLYYKGSYHPSNSINFNSQNTLNVGVNVYEKGYKESINQMKNLKTSINVASKAINYAGYIDGASKLYEGNIAGGTHSMANNYTGIKIGASLGWGYGLLYTASYTFIENTLPKSELYNRIMFGKNSPIYRSRSHYWFESKTYTGEQ